METAEGEMTMRTVPRGSALAALLIAGAATVSVSPIPATAASAGSHRVYVIQGVPGQSVDIDVDGKTIESGVKAKAIVGPLDLGTGSHDITFTSDDFTVESSFDAGRASQDVVLHRPADPSDDPEVTVFNNDVQPVAAGKGRVTVAHTAVVPPADIVVNGDVLFTNIANGEFVSADVPADTYSVEVVPTGQKSDPLLGPVDLPIKAGALTRVFAIGQPENGSMDAVVQVLPVGKGGSPAPGSVDAGEAGLAATTARTGSTDETIPLLVLGGVVILGLTVAGLRRVRVTR
jgi:hypothetical protein